MDCPYCDPIGSGLFRGQACLRCGGTKTISAEDQRRIECGRRMKRERQERGESITVAARTMGIRSHDLTLIENGWPADPDRIRQNQGDSIKERMVRAR